MLIFTYMISTQFYKKTIVCADILVKPPILSSKISYV